MFQDHVSEEIPLAQRPRRARPAKLPVSAPQPTPKAVLQAIPAVTEANMAVPAEVDAAVPVKANASVPAEMDAANLVDANVGKVPPVAAEATMETSMYPQDLDLGIPPQEATSAYVRIPVFYFSVLFFSEF